MTGRDRTVVVVVLVVVAIAASWLLVISPKRDQAARLGTQVSHAQSTLNAARTQLAQGEAARRAFRGSYATLVRLGEAVPTDDDVPSLIYQLQSAASKAGVDFIGLTLNPAGPGGSASTTPAPGTPATSPSTSGTPGSSAAAGASSASSYVLPPGAGVGPAGFPIEPFTFSFSGNFFHLSNFFGRLEQFVVSTNRRLAVNGRLLTLDAINLTPNSGGFPQITASVSATTYLLPTSQGLVAGATPAGPAPVETSQHGSGSSDSSAPPAAAVTP